MTASTLNMPATENMDNTVTSDSMNDPYTPESNETNNQEEEDRGYGTVTSISPLLELKMMGRNNAHTDNQVWLRRENQTLGHHGPTRKSVRGFPENIEKFRMLTSLDDLRSLRLWRAVAAEIVGTLILVLVGCGSCIQKWPGDSSPESVTHNGTVINITVDYSSQDIVQISLAFGLSVATVVWIIGHISGGHINPAVTCAMLVTRRVSLARAFLFIVGQLLGAIAGAGILRGVTPVRQDNLGLTSLGTGVDGVMGVSVEFCITFVLVLTVFAACDKARKDLGGSFPLTIGLSVTMCHLFAIKFTGSSMNTARSFGPAVVMGMWKDHWVYWVGPLLGGVVAGLLYDNVFAANASLAKCTGCLLASKYDHETYPPRKFKIKILEEEDENTVGLKENVAPGTRKEHNVV